LIDEFQDRPPKNKILSKTCMTLSVFYGNIKEDIVKNIENQITGAH